MRNRKPGWIGWITVIVACVCASGLQAGNTWDGGSLADDNWGSGANWDLDTAPTLPGLLTFGGTTRVNPYNNLAS